jgi:hypothetical protein
MATRKKLENEITGFDRTIQSLRRKVNQLASYLRTNQNQQMQNLLASSASQEATITNRARDLFTTVLSQAEATIADANLGGGRDVLPWSQTPAWADIEKPSNPIPPEFVRIGQLTKPAQLAEFPVTPALLPLVKSNHVLVFHPRQLLAEGSALISSIAWRISASTSPKNYRLTLIDSIDQGNNFASFLSLPENIRGDKIVCQGREIETTLQSIVGEMQDVIQQRLRENYYSIEEYNAANPLTAVPYHFILFTALPDGFSQYAADHLTAIARSGIRAGYYLIGGVNTGDFRESNNLLPRLIENSACIALTNPGQAIWDDATFANLPLAIDLPPCKELQELISLLTKDALNEISDTVGIARFVSKDPDWQNSSSQAGLSVPVGVDQNGKPFLIQFGPSSDSFHALVGGRINSGKSNFLHALILSLCNKYSADELNLYLVDFKEGVEFQDYALHRLPHARAIVIEAEREFGLSILQFLRDEMETRSNEFKSLGANVVNIEDYRSKTQKPMPRIVAVLDEFVKLFEEDDAISDEAYRLLLQIAQRSRAFGIHLILSAQRPVGSFQNLNPVKSQIGLRIAFKCNDRDDSALILGEGNEKAATLDRPGSAYLTYEPTMPSRSNLVQIGFVIPDYRKQRLQAINQYYQPGRLTRNWEPLVFSKWQPVYWHDCSAIKANFDRLVMSSEPIVWLGQPVRLAEDRSIAFLKEENDNALLLGSDETLAFQTLIHAVLSIALTKRPDQVEFFWLSASNKFANANEYIQEFVRSNRHPLEICSPDTILSTLTELVGRMERRKKMDTDKSQIFLLIPGLHRINEFRQTFAESPTSGELLERLLHEGPQVGIHVIAWADRFETLRNSMSFSVLKNFNHRIAFHMSIDDSNVFLGDSAASKLGTDHRLIYRNQRWAERTIDKVKPYTLPAIDEYREIVRSIKQRWE